MLPNISISQDGQLMRHLANITSHLGLSPNSRSIIMRHAVAELAAKVEHMDATASKGEAGRIKHMRKRSE